MRSLSSSPELIRERSWLWKWLAVGLCLGCVAGGLQATELKKNMSQYVRERWGSERGFPRGQVNAIAQTDDGYLWIGTAKGLIRFDGLSFYLFQKSNAATAPTGPVLGLMTDSEGNLWIRQQGAVLLRYFDGKFEDLTNSFERNESAITAMCRGKDGRAIFSGILNGVVQYKGGKFLKLASMPATPNFLAISMAEMSEGRVLLGTRDTGVFQLDAGHLSPGPEELRNRKINCLLPSDRQGLWIGTDNGLLYWDGKQLAHAAVSPAFAHAQILALGRDRQSNTWVGMAGGLIRIDSAGTTSVDEEHRSPVGGVTAIFEDREGNVWTGSAQGLERFRDGVFTTYSGPEGLPTESNGPIYVDFEGRTWFAPSEGGLYWLKDGVVGHVVSAGLDNDVVYSVTGNSGEIWAGRQRGGLTHLYQQGGEWASQTYTQAQGLAQNSVYTVHQNRDGTVWAATLSGGLSRFKDGKFSNYMTANGLASNTVASVMEGSDDTMWFATPKGVSAFSKGRWQSFTLKEGLPSEDVICLFEDSSGVIWIGTGRGLAAIRSGNVWVPRELPDSLREPILGMEQDRKGDYWIATSNRVMRVDGAKLLQGKLSADDLREYGMPDGLRGTEGVRRSRSVVADQAGRIWFSMNRGISFVDAARATGSAVPALVHIEGISADGRAIDLGKDAQIPAGHQRVTIRYAGLSLSAPERVRFKYKLEGYDRDWSPPTAEREASYTNLDASPYSFHVLASNSEGQWNSSESVVQFKINPVFWQTWWFQFASASILALAVLMFYRLRVLGLTQQMTMRFEERLAERTRIAQELHDTLLQGFLSASMQLHVADDQLAPDSPAKPMVSKVLKLMERVIDEGRNTLRGLRTPARGIHDLEQAFTSIHDELAMQEGLGFRVIVEGASQPLRPAVQQEVYAIGREALVNALRHSRGSDIEVEIEYAASHLRVLVRDNGCGIDPQVVVSGRDGHWGLSGMRERAESIGAGFRVLSGPSAGTEVELSIPGNIAYEYPPSEGPRRWFSKLRSPRLSEHRLNEQRQK